MQRGERPIIGSLYKTYEDFAYEEVIIRQTPEETRQKKTAGLLKCIPAVFLCIVIIPCFLLIRTFLHQTLFSLIMVQILLSTISQAKQYLLRTFKIN